MMMSVGTAFGSLSNPLPPLTFVDHMDPKLARHWVAVAARFNPVDWGVVASRLRRPQPDYRSK
jgi:hypothetical protein